MYKIGNPLKAWLDKFRSQFTRRFPESENFIPAKEFQDKIQTFRTGLKCESFQWYLKNIVKTLKFRPLKELAHFGEIKSCSLMVRNHCLEIDNKDVRINSCTSKGVKS